MFTVESKSQLAKLLASENLIVEHKNIPTAYFNLKTRTLSCPIWKDMSGDLYDLLMGHEVGHALFTPEQGWHDAVCSEGKNFKAFLNVIEDARIEKKIKRKYPGIKRNFVNAYTDLLDRDFFGIKKRNIETLPFIDKVNLYTKTDGTVSFEFDSEQKSMLNRVLACETWQDVVDCAKEIFEYSKDEQQSLLEEYFNSPQSSNFDDSFDDELEDFEFESDEGPETESEMDETTSQSEESTETDDVEQSDDDTDSFGKNFESGSDYEDFEPVCETDDFYRDNEVKLLDDECKEYVYVSLPKPILKNMITPYKIVHSHLSDFFEQRMSQENVNQTYRDFRNKNDKYISLMVKEFEMRKSAKAYLKSKVAETGDIDINKIYKYQVEDNIFRKVTVQPKGKSHGLILLLDCSGSMQQNMGASIEQILVLALFCKKVNIPFVVYGFSDVSSVRVMDFPDRMLERTFSSEENSLILEDTFLREYLNSTMNTNEFNKCVRNMTMLAKQYKSPGRRIPYSEALGSTPLIQAMISLQKITKLFKKTNNLDIVNTVVVHDGDADWINQYRNGIGKYTSLNTERQNVYINDKENKFQVKLEKDPHPIYNYDYAMKNAIFQWYKKTTGSKIYGFFIVGTGQSAKKNIFTNYRTEKNENLFTQPSNRYYSRPEVDHVASNEIYEFFKKNKFLESNNKGYDSFYFIPGGKDLEIENEELQVTGNVTKSKLKTAFAKLGKKKQTNRILVNKFISGIA